MIPAALCTPITLTLRVSEVLYSAIEVTAVMAASSVNSVITAALRQVAFLRDTEGEEIEVVEVHHAPHPIRRPETVSTPGGPGIGILQQAILARLPAGSVGDLREVRRELAGSYLHNSVSRAIGTLIRGGYLEPVRWSGGTFVPADRQGQLRFVKRK